MLALGIRQTMDDEILVCGYSDDSRRHAILADNGLTGIVYLHAPSDDGTRTGEVEATCFAYNRVEPIETKDVQRYRPDPPPIAKGYASKDAVCQTPELHEWGLKFSPGGTAVLLIRDGNPWALASLDEPRGLSKAIEVPGPWGKPWSSEVHKAREWDGRTSHCT